MVAPQVWFPGVEELRGNMMFESYDLVGSLSDIWGSGRRFVGPPCCFSPILTHAVNASLDICSHCHVQHNSMVLLDFELTEL